MVRRLEELFESGEMKRLGMGARRVCYEIPCSGLCVKCYRTESEIAEGQHPGGPFRPLREAVVREIRSNRNSDAGNTSCQEWRYYKRLKLRLPADLMKAFPETLERVFVPSRGWCLVESMVVNADGTPSKNFPDAFAEAYGREARERLVLAIEDFFKVVAKAGIRFYDPQNTIVQYAADGSFRLRIVDFEPAARTLVPLDSIVPELVGLKVRRRFARFMRENRFRMRMKYSDDEAFLAVLTRLQGGKLNLPVGNLIRHVERKRRIGLFTIFRCTNYGAVLQAVALRRVLGKMFPDAEIEVIDHWMDPRDTHLLGKVTNPNTPLLQRWRNRIKFARRYFAPELFEARRAKTVSLIRERLAPLSFVYRSPAEFCAMPPYETVVVGSDQIWNPGLNHDFPVNQYLCTEFPKGQRRVAYAASFGVGRLPDGCRDMYRSALGRFAAITVREESGAAICEGLIGSHPEVVLDPTLLLNAEEWLEIAMGESRAQCRAAPVVAYWVRAVQQADVDALARIARERGCEVRLLSAGPLAKLDFPVEVKPFVDADPLDFVRTIAGAQGVVTDSFHGLQFAVLFGKPFVALGDLSDSRSNAARLVDFCRLVGADGGCMELSAFRAGADCRLCEKADLAKALAAMRARSVEALKAMVDCGAGGVPADVRGGAHEGQS